MRFDWMSGSDVCVHSGQWNYLSALFEFFMTKAITRNVPLFGTNVRGHFSRCLGDNSRFGQCFIIVEFPLRADRFYACIEDSVKPTPL